MGVLRSVKLVLGPHHKDFHPHVDGGRLVDWSLVFRDLALQLVAGVGKPKPTSISSFFFHLYDS